MSYNDVLFPCRTLFRTVSGAVHCLQPSSLLSLPSVVQLLFLIIKTTLLCFLLSQAAPSNQYTLCIVCECVCLYVCVCVCTVAAKWSLYLPPTFSLSLSLSLSLLRCLSVLSPHYKTTLSPSPPFSSSYPFLSLPLPPPLSFLLYSQPAFPHHPSLSPPYRYLSLTHYPTA